MSTILNEPYLVLRRVCKNHNIKIDLEGKIIRYTNRQNTIFFMSLIIIVLIIDIIKKIEYQPVTISSNTLYSRIVANHLNKLNIPFVLSKSTNRISYYDVEDNNQIPFQGRSYNCYSSDMFYPLIPLTKEELDELETHTKLDELDKIQSLILRNNIFIEESSINNKKSPILSVKPFCKNLLYVVGFSDVWITNTILTDGVLPLQPLDSVVTLKQNTIVVHDDKNKDNTILRSSNSCFIVNDDRTTTLTKENEYNVAEDLTIISSNLFSIKSDNDVYSLKNCRPFHYNSIYTIHPFHLPITWNPYLSVIITAVGAILEKH